MEEWKSIPGYDGLYEVSNTGKIKSLNGCHNKGPEIKKQRYFVRADRKDAMVTLSKNGKKKTFRVARLVAMAWCEGYREELTVNHIDGNTLNNNAVNLEWITNEDNIRHGHNTGRYRKRERPCVLIDSRGSTKKFLTRTEACRFLNRPASYISSRAYLKSNVAYSLSGEQYGFV